MGVGTYDSQLVATRLHWTTCDRHDKNNLQIVDMLLHLSRPVASRPTSCDPSSLDGPSHKLRQLYGSKGAQLVVPPCRPCYGRRPLHSTLVAHFNDGCRAIRFTTGRNQTPLDNSSRKQQIKLQIVDMLLHHARPVAIRPVRIVPRTA